MTDEAREILAFEKQFWKSPGAKDEAIRAHLGISPVRYHQRLNALLDTREALELDPVLVKRLWRVRDLLGHSSAALTLDRYGHLFDDDLDAVADALGGLLDMESGQNVGTESA